MPEMHFHIRWPDGTPERCYSPSLVVKDHLTPGATYGLDEFLDRARTALNEASARVAQRYGHPCSLALGQLARIETMSRRFQCMPDARIGVERFEQ
ncbi:MAG: MSMEG_0570 family nitrogen starvation response protein [Ancalomicrobiaceae bacterium]|nr:MSMEG_0570 family nitrogen starvation response protein [Ancalomicrobiaceae bacterium]